MTTTTARAAWAQLNESLTLSELTAAVAVADAGDYSAADADIEEFNRNRNSEDDQPLTRNRWYLGILDAIDFINSTAE